MCYKLVFTYHVQKIVNSIYEVEGSPLSFGLAYISIYIYDDSSFMIRKFASETATAFFRIE